MNSLKIVPFIKPCNGIIDVPGSKSISNRALILATLCDGRTELSGILESEDVSLMKKALSSLGVEIISGNQKNSLFLDGCAGNLLVKEQELYVGNAGTVARFLTALLALQKGGVYHLDGCEAMRRRPMNELIDALSGLGCRFEFQDTPGCFPFTMHSNGIEGDNWEVDATKSSQVLSALLMISPLINPAMNLSYRGGTVSEPFVHITLEMMKSFSSNQKFKYLKGEQKIHLESEGYAVDDFAYEIEPDATAASYFLTLPLATGGECLVEGISQEMLQGDSKYHLVLESLGFIVKEESNGLRSNFTKNLHAGNFDFNSISDTFLSLAAVSPLLKNEIVISGIAHTRKQETDRVLAMACELRKLGQGVIETEDSLTILPNLEELKRISKENIEIETYEDHRFAMSFAILGSHDLHGNGRPWLTIKNPNCCAKTFPGFFENLDKIRLRSHS